MYLKNVQPGAERLLEMDDDPVPRVSVERVGGAGVENLNAAEEWEVVDGTGALTFLPLTQVSTFVWSRTFATDGDWGVRDIIVNANCHYQAVAYTADVGREFVGPYSRHGVVSAEAIDLAVLPLTATLDAVVPGRHLHVGDPVAIILIPVDETGTLDETGYADPEVAFVRLGPTGTEHLTELAPPYTWIAADDVAHPNGGEPIYLSSGSATFLFTAAFTEGFDGVSGSVFLYMRATFDPTELSEHMVQALRQVDVLGANSAHDEPVAGSAPALDAVGLALTGGITFR